MLDQVFCWLRDASTQSLLLEGPPGVGKTAFMAHLLEKLPEKHYKAAFHFCRFDVDHTLLPGEIVRGLAAQLARLVPAYKTKVEADNDARRALDDARADPAKAWHMAVIGPLLAVEPSMRDQPVRIVIVIDALDESLELHQRDAGRGGSLLDLIRVGQSAGLPTWVRVVMSSRELDQRLPDRIHQIHMLDGGGHVANREDLEAYVRHRMDSKLVRALADGMTPTADAFVHCIADLCHDTFLLARLLLDATDREGFDADALRRVLVGSREMPGLDAYYLEVFSTRIPRARLDKVRMRALLGLVAVVREPLTEAAIAEVLGDMGVTQDDVRDAVNAMGGLLLRQNGSVKVRHLSLEDWLDPSRDDDEEGKRKRGGLAKAGAYAIERDASVRRLQLHCKSVAALRRKDRKARAFASYLQHYGVVHLVDADEIAAALALLKAQTTEAVVDADAADESPDRLLEGRVLDGIDGLLAAFDKGDDDAANELRDLEPDHLAWLLEERGYETGRYQPVIRALIQFHPKAWSDVEAALLDEVKKDLVFRNDIGVAHAEAWHSSRRVDKKTWLEQIRSMALGDDGTRREIAGYALKNICQRRHGGPWWRELGDALLPLVVHYTCSDDATDRMVGGEILLALTIQGVLVRDWLDGKAGAERFWNPYWPNHRTDIDSIRVLTSTHPHWGELDVDQAASLAASRAQHEWGLEIGKRLASQTLFRRSEGGVDLSRLACVVDDTAEQQCDKAALVAARETLAWLADRDEGREEVLDVIRRVMLHPLWDVTESGASLVADLLEGGRDRWWIVDRLLDADPVHWRLHYGAIDASFSAGGSHDHAQFLRGVARVGSSPNCRVRGICADDLRAVLKEANVERKARILADPGIRQVLRDWLETADDVWLLEYLHHICSELHADEHTREMLRELLLLPTRLSRYLESAPGEPPFYALSPEAFMEDIEGRRAEVARPTSPT